MLETFWEVRPRSVKMNVGDYPWQLLEILSNRGFKSREEVEGFLNPDYEKEIHSPFLFRQMEDAVKLIIQHIVERNKIIVYGDYDGDGVTASVVLSETLSTLKANVDVYIPDRTSEGYSLNKKAIERFAQDGIKLVITVDCGIKNKSEIEFAKEKGIDVILTDHHLPNESKGDSPDCIIIDPVNHGEKYPFKKLTGVGVAFKLACAVIERTKLANKEKKILEKRILDLVAIGTITDRFPLFGENRVLVFEGLRLINEKKQRIGLQELIKVSYVDGDSGKKIDADAIGFQIGPRINAAGRMGNATAAFDLLISRDIEKAKSLARHLNEQNMERQTETEEIVRMIKKGLEGKELDRSIVAVAPLERVWNEGVIGLAAGKICEANHRPTLVITRGPDGMKGSGRSIPNFDLSQALQACEKYLSRWGGHTLACGFSLEEKNLEKFKEVFQAFVNKKINNNDLVPSIFIDVEMELDEATLDLYKALEKLAPLGVGNEKPIFLSRNVIIADIIKMGNDSQHIRLKITNGRSGAVQAIGFCQSEKWKHLSIGDRIDICYNLNINHFNGHSDAQLKIIDIKKID